MISRVALCCLLLATTRLQAVDTSPTEKELAVIKDELMKLGEFIGPWNNSGEGTVNGKKSAWKETLEWSWKFAKSGMPSIVLKVKDGKFFEEATINYSIEAKGYTASVKNAKGTADTYMGNLDKRGYLVLERTDDASKDVHKLKFGTAAAGIRLNVAYDVQAGGKGLASTLYKSNGNKEGESLAGSTKKNECIVTGGAATIQVSYSGKAYYVCCSGCADAFKEEPEKFIKAAAAKK